jgi:hypothetical protein
MNSRNIKLPIKYERDRKTIRQVKLYVAHNGENTWYQEQAVPPDREFFSYIAKEDGIYWFTMVEEDLQGRNNPADLTHTPPDLKVIVDTVQPRVQFTTAKRNGDEVIVEWFIDDKYPDENKTQVHFRPTGTDAKWVQVSLASLPAGAKSGVRFPAGTSNPVTVRVTAFDYAGNMTEAIRDIPANTPQSSTSMSAPLPTVPVTSVSTGGSGGSGGAGNSGGSGGTAIPAPDLGPIAPAPPAGGTGIPPHPGTGGGAPLPQREKPLTPVDLGPVAPTPPGGGPGTLITHPTHVGTGSSGTPSMSGQLIPGSETRQAVPTVDPRQPVVQAGPPSTGSSSDPTPVAVWTGPSGVAAPTVEVSRAQFINYLSFDMNYEVESRGPSGIRRVDLYVTRDDGKTWIKWSEHDGKATSVRVNLGVPANPQPEGTYGFRLVPVSGANLSEREPAPGDSPDLRVVVDITPPQLTLYKPKPDTFNPDTLIIRWQATDKNFGDDPITIEWSEKPTGPWQPVASNEVVQTGTGQTPQVRRLPNTGSFAWRVPFGVPPSVYLKMSARDAAGNVREVVTLNPETIDLVKPKAKISGIIAPAGGIVRP